VCASSIILRFPIFSFLSDTPIPRAPPCILGIYLFFYFIFFLPLNVFVSPTVCVLRSLVVCSSCCLAAIRRSPFFYGPPTERIASMPTSVSISGIYRNSIHPSIFD
jgi:hypothetical protein